MVSSKALEITDMIMGDNLCIRNEVSSGLHKYGLARVSSNKRINSRDFINLIVQATLDILKHEMEYSRDGDNYIDKEKRRLKLTKLIEMPPPPLESDLSKLRQENAEREKQIEAMKQYISEQKKKLGMEEGPGLMERLIERRMGKDEARYLGVPEELSTELRRLIDAIKGKKEGESDNKALMDKLLKDIETFLGEN